MDGAKSARWKATKIEPHVSPDGRKFLLLGVEIEIDLEDRQLGELCAVLELLQRG